MTPFFFLEEVAGAAAEDDLLDDDGFAVIGDGGNEISDWLLAVKPCRG